MCHCQLEADSQRGAFRLRVEAHHTADGPTRLCLSAGGIGDAAEAKVSHLGCEPARPVCSSSQVWGSGLGGLGCVSSRQAEEQSGLQSASMRMLCDRKLDFFVKVHEKRLVDTASRTADAGYLTQPFVDAGPGRQSSAGSLQTGERLRIAILQPWQGCWPTLEVAGRSRANSTAQACWPTSRRPTGSQEV